MTKQEQMVADMKRLKAYFPYRYVWGAISPEGTEQVSGANATKRRANDLARKGWTVYEVTT